MIIKVCGMRDGENIRQLERLNPDMTGFICWEKSSRYVRRRPDYLPRTCRTGVFVNPTVDFLTRKARELELNKIQLHGNESPELCRAIYETTRLPIIKAIAVDDITDIQTYLIYDELPEIDMFLFDTRCTTAGGSGLQFDWDILRHYDGRKPFLLAGGIGPDDVQRVLHLRHPRFAGIDINSRFETAPAIKNITLLADFINAIRNEQN